MNEFLGIDAGGSNFRIAVINDNGNIIYHKSLKGNFNYTSAGNEIIDNYFKKIKKEFNNIKAVSIAMAGIGTKDQKIQLKSIIFNNLQNCKKVNIFTDAEGSLEANFQSSSGILIICGTGSIVIGKNDNNTCRAGGWGYLLDDEGSGFWFSKKIVMEYLRYVDGISSNKEIFDLVNEKFNGSPREIISDFYRPEKRNLMASLSLDFLKNSNSYIKDLINTSVFHNVQRIKKVKKELKIKKPKIAFMGGMFNNEFFLDSFKKTLMMEIEYADVIKGITEIEIELAKNAKKGCGL